MFHYDYAALDEISLFTGHHASLREHYVVQLPKGLSMVDEWLACDMQLAAHERRFMTTQRGLTASNFHDEHVSIVSRTIDVLESNFLNAGAMMQGSTFSRSATPVDPAGCAEYLSDVKWQPSDWTNSAANLDSNSTLDLDLKDPVEDCVEFDLMDTVGNCAELAVEDAIDDGALGEISGAEVEMLLQQTRKRRKWCYRSESSDLRVSKHARSKGAIKMRSKHKKSSCNFPTSAPGP